MNDNQTFAVKINSVSKSYFDSRKKLKNFFLRKRNQGGFVALKEISLTIQKGECFGLIGKNGSGKSTLLQIISGITKPTCGDYLVNGKIASILELGSAFNPEFSGRENIYLGALLYGLSRGEIRKKYNDILSFAEIGDFVERPVKEYSTGMLMRLAFSIIVNVEADILLVDEALSVGDIYFSQKCIRFFNDFKKKGTLIIVTHDLQILSSICDRVGLISNGQIKEIGDVKKVLNSYLNEFRETYSERKREAGIDNISGKDTTILTLEQNKKILSRSVKISKGQTKIESFGKTINGIKKIENDSNESQTGKRLRYKVNLDDIFDENEKVIGLNITNSKVLMFLSEIIEIIDENENKFLSRIFYINLKIPYLIGGEYTLEIGLARGTLVDHQFIQMIYDFERWYVSHQDGDFGVIRTECQLSTIFK